MVLAMSSTFAGNLILIGSAANLIVAERAEARAILKASLRVQLDNMARRQDASPPRELEINHDFLLFNEFKSIVQQRIVIERLLPLHALEEKKSAHEHLYEPGPREIFEKLLPKVVETTVWQAMLESNAAEHGARMAAMDAATRNANQTIDSLTLYMNKVRQAAITKEIIEVVSGSAA